jgi:hypothetical protein
VAFDDARQHPPAVVSPEAAAVAIDEVLESPARISPWRRMPRSRVPSKPGRFFAAQFSAGCTTNMSAFDFRQAHLNF